MARKNRKSAAKFSRLFEAETQEELDRQIADAGRGAGQREYWAAVKSFAREALNENPEDEEAQDNYLWETIDGCSWIIYNAENLEVLRFTSHDDAWEEYGELDPSKAITQIAFAAMLADAREELQELRDAKRAAEGDEAQE